MGMIPEALAQMERAATLVSDDPVVSEHLGDVRFKAGQVEGAIEAWRRALALTPDNAALKQKIEDAQRLAP
jgi:predicted TPR repeat methyltransferase